MNIAMSTQETVEWNGEEHSKEAFEQATRIAINSVSGTSGELPTGVETRTDYLNNLGQQFGGDRDIYDVLGYPEEIEFDDYLAKYERDIGKRIVQLPADDSWQKAPEITDNPDSQEQSSFEREINRFVRTSKAWHYARRTDVLAGIGQFAVLFIGFTDDADIEEEVDQSTLPSDETEAVSHYEPFAQDSVEEWELGKEAGKDPSNPRYNKPVRYKLDFGDAEESDATDAHWVHWTRVLHVPSDGRDESDLLGTPRLKDVYNRLIDLEKTVGASAEIFWTGASPRYQFNVDTDDASDVPDDELAKLDEEVQKLVHDMQNYIKTFNTDVEVISGEEVDPSGVHDVIVSNIAGTKGIPKRILTGSERGELASTQDRATWLSTVSKRQTQYNEPTVVRPFVDRLRKYDVLSEPADGTYEVNWPELFELNEIEKSELEVNRSEVIANIAPKGNTDLIASFEEIMEYVKTGKKPDFDGDVEPALPEDDPQVRAQFGQGTGDNNE